VAPCDERRWPAPLDGVHAASELEQGRVDVGDATGEASRDSRVDAVVACVDDELDAVLVEEVAHRDVSSS
jgi:hypothetical protein